MTLKEMKGTKSNDGKLGGLIGYKEVGSIMIQRLIFIQTGH